MKQRSRLWLYGLILAFFTTLVCQGVTFQEKAGAAAKIQDISKEEYAQRREKVMEKFSDGMVILRAPKINWHPKVSRDTPIDIPHKYHFYYLTGIKETGAVLLLISRTKKVALFIKADAEGCKKVSEQTGIADVKSLDDLDAFVQANGKDTKKIYTDGESKKTADTVKNALEGAKVDYTKFNPFISKLRMIKSPAEIALLKKAAEASAKAHIEVMKRIRPGMFEYEIQKIFEDVIEKELGERTMGYGSIVASGKNALTLHYVDNNKKVKDGDLLLIDAAAKCKGYSADITRTYPVNGKFTDRQRELYQACLDAQKKAEQLLKPGVMFQEFNKAAYDLIESKNIDGFKIRHPVYHYIGLDVHDCGSYDAFKAGVAHVIEPGIYLDKEEVGIRIEDNYVITEDGYERISSLVPREMDEIEKLMAEGRKEYGDKKPEGNEKKE